MRAGLLALSKESSIKLNSCTTSLTQEEIPKTDYEFYITNKENDNNKYYIGAFYTMKTSGKVRKW